MSEKIEIDRTRVGIVALVFAAGALGLFLWAPERQAVMSSLLRMSILLGAIWLAAPTKHREAAWAKVSPWMLVLGFITLFLLVRFPFIVIPILLGLFVLSMFVKPIRPKRPRSSAAPEAKPHTSPEDRKNITTAENQTDSSLE